MKTATCTTSGLFSGQVLRFFSLLIVASAIVGSSLAAQAKIDVAELQFALCEADPTHVVDALSGKVSDREQRDVYYLETRGRDFERSGAVMRYRLNEKGVKSAAKVSFVQEQDIPTNEIKKFDPVCEVDAYLSRAKIGCSVKDNDQKVGTFSKDQKSFFKKAGIDASVIGRGQIWGPVRDVESTFKSGEIEFTLGTYYVAAGITEIELSTRVSTVDALGMQQRLLSLIYGAGLKLCPEQIGVTKKILDQFIGPDHDPR